MRHFVLFLIVGVSISISHNYAFGWCDQNDDWPDAPCYSPYQSPSKEKLQQDWAPYYEYKGHEWMREKRAELVDAVITGKLDEWIEKAPDSSHKNVYTYYSLFENLQAYKKPPLKQIQSGIKWHNVECHGDLELAHKKGAEKSACVTIFTKIELIVRGWAHDNRVLLGCIGDRVSKCYPDDPKEYRNKLYDYYFGKGDLPSSNDYDFSALHTINACIDKPRVCYGEFDNGTKIRISCDYPIHSCGVRSFDNYTEAENENLTVSWKKYITISAARIDAAYVNDTINAYKLDDVQPESILYQALVGADGCKNETEVCAISRGISLERSYPFGISVTDHDDYSVTLNARQANDLLSKLAWIINENLTYAIVQWNEKYYFLMLSTFDQTKTPDVQMNVIGSSHDPIHLDRGSTLNYTIQVNAWATYGAPAQVDFRAAQSAKDSGMDVWIEPAMLTVQERSNATTTLFIQPQEDAKDGIYNMRVIAHVNGNSADLHCGNTVCPAVMMGNSDWLISTFGTSGGIWMGKGEAPDQTWAEIELNKKEFFEGDVVEIKTYLINNGTEPVILNPTMNLLIKVIKAEPNGYYDHFYGINAVKEAGEPVLLEADSKTLLARTFYWNQTTFHDFDDGQRLEPSKRMVTMDFTAGNYTWNSDAWIEIK